MSENIQRYGIKLEFQSALQQLRKFRKASENFNKYQDRSLKQRAAKHTLLAEKIRREQKLSDKIELEGRYIVEREITKRKAIEEKQRTRQAVAEAKKRQRLLADQGKIESARRVQAVSNITAPSGASSMRDFYKQQERDAKKAPTVDKSFVGPQISKTDQSFLMAQARERTKEAQKLQRAEDRRVASLRKARNEVEGTALMQKVAATAAEKNLQAAIRTAMADAKSGEELRNRVRLLKASTAEQRKQHFLMQRMQSSSEQFAGNMVSAFAVAAGGAAITRIGQDFESINSTMLAVSGNAETASENLSFVKEEAFRLGVDLKQTSKQYTRMLAAQGEMEKSDVNNLFIGMAEASTVLGLSADESSRAFIGIAQMMSKNQVMAQEMKEQVGEVIPNAMQAMAKATQQAGLSVNGTISEMFKLMEEGKVKASAVLPFFAENMREFAKPGLKKAIDSNRVAMNRMMTSMQMSSNQFFQSGFGEGLTDLFNSIAKFMKENIPLWESFGRILGGALKGLSFIIDEILTPVFSALGSILNAVTTLLGDLSGTLVIVAAKFGIVGKAVGWVWDKLSGGKGVLGVLGGAFKRLLFPIYLVLGALEELAEFFVPTGKKTLIGVNINDLVPDIEGFTKAVSENQTISVADKALQAKTLENMYKRQPSSFSQQGNITVQGDVYLDGQKVGEQVMKSEAAKNATNLQHSGFAVRNF